MTVVSPVTATLDGFIMATGGGENPDVYFCWGASAPETDDTNAWNKVVGIGDSWGQGDTFSHVATGLHADSSYYYRIFVTNGTGGAWSAVRSFSTIGYDPTGGNATNDVGSYRIHAFTDPGTHTFTVNNGNVTVLLVGGGGGGGLSRDSGGGGGGGGVVLTNLSNVTGRYTIRVGAGGAGAVSSNNVNTLSANGGNSGSGIVLIAYKVASGTVFWIR